MSPLLHSSRRTIREWLIKRFATAILIPSLLTAAVGTTLIRRQVYSQAQAQVGSDLKGAMEIWRNYSDSLKDAIRIHSSRMVIYRALDQKDTSGLGEEMERVRQAEGLDILTLTDASGHVFYRTRNPSTASDSQAEDEIVGSAMRLQAPVVGPEIVPAEQLSVESPELARQARMEVASTPKSGPAGKAWQTSGMVLKAASPVFYAGGKRFLGVLYGGVLLNRNFGLVDKISSVVFKAGLPSDRETGTATIFQDSVRISTNVRNADGSRAVATRVSAEVADEVLRRGHPWRGRAFVVNDWYFAAYEPIKDIAGETIGMLYVGTPERPFEESLRHALLIFLGITVLGVVLVSAVAVAVAGSISRPIHAMAGAAEKVAQGDYSTQVDVTSEDEIGHLAECFNRMVRKLSRADLELRQWGENLESKVEERTAQLKAMQGSLIQTEKLAAIGKLAAGVAHEINNPLTGILTNSSLMLQDLPEDDPRRDDLQLIVDETLRCRKIVKGLLDFSRQTKPQKQLVDMNDVVEDVFSLVRNQSIFHDIAIEVKRAEDLPAVMADKDQLRQVVLNVILNAAEAMPGSGKISAASCLAADGGHVEIKIRDNGPGIPEQIRDKLFEPFFTTKKNGTGLGLAIAYGIMERHKGTITIDSALGRGTTITLRLPTITEEADD